MEEGKRTMALVARQGGVSFRIHSLRKTSEDEEDERRFLYPTNPNEQTLQP